MSIYVRSGRYCRIFLFPFSKFAGAFAYLLVSGLLVAFRVDDPVDAIAVHGAGGIVGILAVPVFMEVTT